MNSTQPDQNATYQRILELCEQAGATLNKSRMNDPINCSYKSKSGEVEIVFDNNKPHEVKTIDGMHRLPISHFPDRDRFLLLLNEEFELTELQPMRSPEITSAIPTGPVIAIKPKQKSLLPHQTTAYENLQTNLDHTANLNPGTGKTLSPEALNTSSTETFARIVQIWESVGAQYLRPKTPELNRHFPSSSGAIELVLDNKNPVLLRASEGQYPLGGYNYNHANADQFMQQLMTEFDTIEVEPKKPHQETHGCFTGPVIALIPKSKLSFADQIKAISTAIDNGKTVCIAVPNQATKALIRREPIGSESLRITGDHPDTTYFSNGAWLIFLYTTIQNTIKDRQFDVVYYVRGKNLTTMAESCETENLTLLITTAHELHQLQLEVEAV